MAIRERRHRLGVSQEEFGYRVGLHRNYVGGLERGERNPSLEALIDLTSALGVSPSALLVRAEELLSPGGNGRPGADGPTHRAGEQ
jgi:transcriptional regulator with XRE-family HTH domain